MALDHAQIAQQQGHGHGQPYRLRFGETAGCRVGTLFPDYGNLGPDDSLQHPYGGRSARDKREAEWLAAEMRRSIGLDQE